MDSRIKDLAENFIKYSLNLKKGEKIYIEGIGVSSREILMECVRLATEVGAQPFYFFHDDNILKQFIATATPEQMKQYGKYHAGLMKEMDCYLGLRAYDDLFALSDVSAKQMKLFGEHFYNPVHFDIRVPKTRWCVTRIPTETLACMAKMSKEKFEDFYFNSCSMDYKKMEKASAGLRKLMSKTDRVKIVAPNTHLEFSIKNMPVLGAFGHHNMPDGEIFLGPVKDSINGHIQFNTETIHDGVFASNVYLEFKDGKIVKAKSHANDKAFQKVLDTDAGSRYMGEFAIAFNPYIMNSVGEIAFDEKIAGSLHMAIGNSYEDSFNGNRSSVHWDLVQIQRKDYGGGEIWFDDVLIRKDGEFVLKELEPLNRKELMK